MYRVPLSRPNGQVMIDTPRPVQVHGEKTAIAWAKGIMTVVKGDATEYHHANLFIERLDADTFKLVVPPRLPRRRWENGPPDRGR